MEVHPPTQRSVLDLAREAVVDTVGVEGRLWRTLAVLARSPGTLTEAYVSGRAFGVFRPSRLYLYLSLLLFSVTSLADPGRAIGQAILAAEQSYLASDAHGARDELVDDLRQLVERQQEVAGRATAEAARLEALRRAALRGERVAAAAAAVAASVRLDVERAGGPRSWTTEEFAAVQSAGIGLLLEWLPLVLFGLVPLYAVGLQVGSGSRRPGIVALVLAVHVHAAAFALLALAVAVAWGSGWVGLVTLLAVGGALGGAAVWQVVALQRVYGMSRVRSVLTTAGVGVAYGALVLVVLGLLYSAAVLLA